MVYRIGATGIDGACKTAIIDGALEKLKDEFSICRVGRRFHYHHNDVIEYPLKRADDLMEKMIDFSDRAPQPRLWVGLVQALFVLMQRGIEPYMERKYKPDLIMNSRCVIIDPSVYVSYYYPAFKSMPVPKRLDVMQKISGAKFRDLYFLFEVSTNVAMQRITEYNEKIQRSHPHETRQTIVSLQQEFEDVMRLVALMPDVEIIRINSSDKTIDKLSDIVARETKNFVEGRPFSPVYP